MTLTILGIILLVCSFVLAAVLTAVVRRWAIKTGFLAMPAPDRFHKAAVPLGGGIAIFSTVAIMILAGIAIVKFLVVPGYLNWLGESVTIHAAGFCRRIPELVIVLLGLLVLHLLGLWDDKKRLGPFVKLAVQFAVAFALAVFADIRVELFIQSKAVTIALSAVWMVVIINAFNFLDNMDGLSAGIAAIAVSILFSAAASSGQVFVGAISLILLGALPGFLVFNFPPAKIFMGDAGSLVVGGLVGIISLRTTYYHQFQSGQWYSVFMPLIVMAVPLYDFCSVTLLRISQGKSPFAGDTQHFSHRLRKRGLSERQTVLTLYLATVCTGLGAAFLRQVDRAGAVLIFIQTVMILAIIAILEGFGTEPRGAGNDKPSQ